MYLIFEFQLHFNFWTFYVYFSANHFPFLNKTWENIFTKNWKVLGENGGSADPPISSTLCFLRRGNVKWSSGRQKRERGKVWSVDDPTLAFDSFSFSIISCLASKVFCTQVRRRKEEEGSANPPDTSMSSPSFGYKRPPLEAHLHTRTTSNFSSSHFPSLSSLVYGSLNLVHKKKIPKKIVFPLHLVVFCLWSCVAHKESLWRFLTSHKNVLWCMTTHKNSLWRQPHLARND